MQVSDGSMFVLCRVTGNEQDDGVFECGFSEDGGSEACGCSVY